MSFETPARSSADRSALVVAAKETHRMNSSIRHSRRDVVKAAVLATGAFSLGGLSAFADDAPRELLTPVTTSTPGKDPWKGLKVGVASYSFRKLPREQTIAGISRMGLQDVSIRDFRLPI